MKILLRATWALNLALCLATILLIPQSLLFLFPAETNGYVIISETGVDPDELHRIGEQAGVEVAQVRHITDFADTTDESFSTASVELLGYKADDYIRPPLTPLLLPEPIAYTPAPSKTMPWAGGTRSARGKIPPSSSARSQTGGAIASVSRGF